MRWSTMANDDPLDGWETLEPSAQIAVVVSVLRSTRNTCARIEKKVDWVGRALWTLVGTVIAGIIVYVVTAHLGPPVQPSTPSQTTPALVAGRAK